MHKPKNAKRDDHVADLKKAMRYGKIYAAVSIAGIVAAPITVPRAAANAAHGSRPTGISSSSMTVRNGQRFTVRAEGSGPITLYEAHFGYYMPAGPLAVAASPQGRLSYSVKAAYMKEVVNGGLGQGGAQGYLFYASAAGGTNPSRSIRVIVRE